MFLINLHVRLLSGFPVDLDMSVPDQFFDFAAGADTCSRKIFIKSVH